MCVWRYVILGLHLQMTKSDIKITFFYLCTLVFDTGLHSQPKAHYLLQASSCLYYPGLGSQYHVLIMILHGFWGSEIMSSCLHSKHLAHWMISQVPPHFKKRDGRQRVRRTVHGEKLDWTNAVRLQWWSLISAHCAQEEAARVCLWKPGQQASHGTIQKSLSFTESN